MTEFRFVALAALTALAACSPKQFESPPVTVQSAQGPVTCQLYTKGLLDWDRAVARPDMMSAETADALCKAEGRARQGG